MSASFTPDPPLSRRAFLAKAGATAAGLALLGSSTARAEDQKIILGTGEHRYECLHDWLTPPDNIRWGDTHGVTQDSKGNIYIAHTVHPTSSSGDAIVVFDKKGKFLRSWGEQFRGGAHGLDIRREGKEEFLYHCDVKNHLFAKTTLDGKVLWQKGAPPEANFYEAGNPKTPFTPTNIAFSPNGDFYVTDGYGSDWIHQYDIKGNYIRTFGGKGKEEGKVLNAHGIWLDTRGKEPLLAVADRGNNRIQYLTLDGKHVKFVTNGMRRPCHFHVRGEMLLVPDLSSVVTLLDKDNKVIEMLGDGDPSKLRGAPRSEFIPGKFIHPHDAFFLQNGDILVTEWVPIGRITLLKQVRG